MFESTTPDLDRITRWRVLMNVGKPVEHRVIVIPWRTVGLAVLLILVGLWGLGARGAEREPLQKGLRGPGQDKITPLEKSKNFSDLSAPTAYNFLEKFRQPASPGALASPKTLSRTFIPESITGVTSFDVSDLGVRRQDRIAFTLMALCLAMLLIIWINLKSQDRYEKGLRGTGDRR